MMMVMHVAPQGDGKPSRIWTQCRKLAGPRSKSAHVLLVFVYLDAWLTCTCKVKDKWLAVK